MEPMCVHVFLSFSRWIQGFSNFKDVSHDLVQRATFFQNEPMLRDDIIMIQTQSML